MRFTDVFAARAARSLFFVSMAALGLGVAGCGVDLTGVFDSGSSGHGASGGGGAGGGTAGNGGTAGTTTSTTSTTTSTSSTTSTTTSSTTTTTTTTTTMGPVCGDGTCNSAAGETPATCPQDCPGGMCAHGVCEWSQDPLQNGCDPCVTAVCGQNPDCCNKQWDGACIGLANQVCNNACCGDGACVAEQCDACVADCGHCAPAPTCAHSVCTGADNAAPLDTASCFDPCIDQVCAVIDATTDNCCNPEPPAWSAECTDKAHMLCPEYACIKDVCAAMPSCCSAHWTGACVAKAVATPSCNTACDCVHEPCVEGNPNEPLDPGCNPCVAAVCSADTYCCNTDWDGICVGEVGTLCGIQCN